MKIAVPTRGKYIDDHFGHCEFYTLFSIDQHQKIEHSEVLASPSGCGCKSNIAEILQQKGVNIMLAGNMGDGALHVLSQHGIKVYRGCIGEVRQLTEAFLKGSVQDSGIGCHHHDQNQEGHSCNH